MLRAFAILLACQLAGETIARALALPLPGPVIGLVILVMLLFAVERRHLVDSSTIDGTSLGKVSNGLLAVLGVLFVPAGVGVIQNYPEDWMKHYFEKGFDRIDPVITYCQNKMDTFTWEEIPQRLRLTRPRAPQRLLPGPHRARRGRA